MGPTDSPLSRREFTQLLGAAVLGPMLPDGAEATRDASRPTSKTMTEPASAPMGGTPADDITTLSAVEMAARIRRKELSAREVLEAHLTRIERVNPRVNAIVTLVPEKARAWAKAADEKQASGAAIGPLHGLPVAHKDLVETAGIRTTRGSPYYKDYVPTTDALIVKRLRAAGAITIGKTNTPEFGAGSNTFNPVFGATRNPFDLSRTVGGSSGGAACALTCNLVPIADGSDTGGSLRNPAAWNNVVGFRPSPGRVPDDDGSWSPLSTHGPMARSVADVALFLSAMAGFYAPDPDGAHRRSRAIPRIAREEREGRRASRGSRTWAACRSSRRSRRVVNTNRHVFADLGCVVEDAEPDFTGVGRCLSGIETSLIPQQLRRDRARAPDAGQGHDQVGDRGSRAADGGGRRARERTSGEDVPRRHRILLADTTHSSVR